MFLCFPTVDAPRDYSFSIEYPWVALNLLHLPLNYLPGLPEKNPPDF
jgi:hypothetical protein